MQKVISEGLPISGTFIKIVLHYPNDNYEMIENQENIILSTLFPNECKVSVMHYKLMRNMTNKDIV